MIFIRTKFSCLFFLLLLATPVLGQKIVIKARDLVTVSVGVAYPLGPSSVSDEATLLSNMNSGKVMRISYASNIWREFYLGATGSYASFGGWNSNSSNLYNKSTVSFTSFTPTIGFRSWSPEGGLGNKLNLNASVSAGIAKIQVDTHPQSAINDGSEQNPLQVKSIRFYSSAAIGGSYTLTNNFSIQLSCDYHWTLSNSEIFLDKSFVYLSVQAGITYRLTLNKSYRFSD